MKSDLVNKKLINHKEPGVQALVSCCISDILRIYAPDAPYTDKELIDIFKLFLRQFSKLSDIENGYYSQQVYLISRLAEVRSIILITDISQANELIEQVFKLFLDSKNQFNKKLEPVISDVLSEIISEWEGISPTVLQLIMNKFLSSASDAEIKSISSTLNSEKYTSSFNLVKNICDFNPDRISRQVTKYFSESLYETTNSNNADSVDFEELKRIHKLTVEIWKSVPELLGSVMGLLQDELNAENEKFRLLATDTLGSMLSVQSKLNFVTTHKDTWINYMKKTLDISPIVRCKWVEKSTGILINRKDVTVEILNGLNKTLIDTDEKVRASTIKQISQIPSESFVSKLELMKSPTTLLNSIIQLSREKNTDIRKEVIYFLGKLYSDLYEDIKKSTENSQESNIYSTLNQIPHALLSLYYINDNFTNYIVDLTLIDGIIPFTINNSTKRVERLLYVLSNLTKKSIKPFYAFTRRQQELAKVLGKFIEFCEENNGTPYELNSTASEVHSKITKTINWFSVNLPDTLFPHETLQKFVNLNNRRLYYLIKLITVSDSDLITIKNSFNEFFKRLYEPKIVKSDSSQYVKLFKILLLRGSSLWYNQSNIEPLLKVLHEEKDGDVKNTAKSLIDDISSTRALVFKTQINNLIGVIMDAANREEKPSRVNTLNALYNIFLKFPDQLQNNKEFIHELCNISQQGTVVESRFAVKIISLTPESKTLMKNLYFDIEPLTPSHEKFETHLSIINSLFEVHAVIVEGDASELTTLLIKEVLLNNGEPESSQNPNGHVAWISDELLETDKSYRKLYGKLLALRIFTSRLKALVSDPNTILQDEDLITKTTENVMKLFGSIISNGGELVNRNISSNPTPKHFQSRLRLEAGLCVLELAKYPEFNTYIKPNLMEKLVLLIQDEEPNVRRELITRLSEYLKAEEISWKFLSLIYLIAFEPDQQLKNEIKTWIKSTFTKVTQLQSDHKLKIVFEISLASLIYHIAHHSEFLGYIDKKNDAESLLKAYSFALEYIAFYLECIANQENVSLLYYVATRVKQYRDASIQTYDNSPEEDENNIYIISELTQLLIKELQASKSWTLNSYPSKLNLATDLFKPITDSGMAHKIVSSSFIEDVCIQQVTGLVRNKVHNITHTNSSGVKRSNSSNDASKTKRAKQEKKDPTVKKESKKRVYRRKTEEDEEDEIREDKEFKYSSKLECRSSIRRSGRRAAERISYVEKEEDEEDSEEGSSEESENESEEFDE